MRPLPGRYSTCAEQPQPQRNPRHSSRARSRRIRPRHLAAFALALACLLSPAATRPAGAQSASGPSTSAKPASGMPPANARQFLNYIEHQNPYKKWQLFPGTTKMHVSTSKAHGTLVTTYVNQIAYGPAKHNSLYPNGSIIVKENFNKQKKFKAITAMYKVAGYNPLADNWFWVKASPDGKKVMKSGKISGCIDCHTKAQSGYVFSK